MPKPKLEKDTEKVLRDQQKVAEFVASEAWQMIRKKLIEKVTLNDSLAHIVVREGASNEELLRELIGRAQASKIVIEWLVEVEGTAAQYQDNEKMLMEQREDAILRFFPERSEVPDR